jgi:hypothetical protein
MPTNQGIAYRLAVANGDLVLTSDVDLIRDHIFSVLETEPRERVMRPGYGTPDFLFTGVRDINLIAQFIRQCLEQEIPGVQFSVTGTIADDGAGQVAVNWQVNGLPQPPLRFELTNG